MYNPDQHYQAHTLHLKELSEQAEQRRMIATLTWLARGATSSRPKLGWRVVRKPAEWESVVALPSSVCATTGRVCDAGGNQSSACHAAEMCIACIP
jgi:hypothetical protein